MPLNPLSLDVTYGVAGRPFQATISGLSAGSTVDVVSGGAGAGDQGFGVANGRVFMDALPSRSSVSVVLRETLAGTGTRDSRIDIAVDGIALGAAGLASALKTANIPSDHIVAPPAFPFDFSKVEMSLSLQAATPVGVVTNPHALIPSGVWSAPVASRVFHVDPVNGSNSNTGLGSYYGDFTNAVQDVATAITKANATTAACRIVIDASSNPWFTRATGGVGTSTFPTVDMAIEAVGGRATFTGSDAHTWAVDGTYANCWSATESNASGAIDLLNQRWLGEAQGARLLDRDGVGRRAYVEMVKYASPTALNTATFTGTTGGGYCNSGGKTYVRRADGTAVTDANTRVFRGTSTIAPAFATHTTAATATNVSLYMAGCDFQGGFLSNNAGTRNVWLNNCRAMYAGLDVTPNQNGFMTDFVGTALFTRCEGWACGNDVFNPHGVNGQHQFVTVDCLGWDTGRTTGQSNNGTTGHESTIVVDLNGDYQMSRGGTARFINNSRALLFGSRLWGDLGDVAMGGSLVPTAIMANDNAWIWALYCDISAGRALYAPDAKSRIFAKGNTIRSGTTSGNVAAL